MDKVIVLVGPTGVGKTALSIALAKAVDGEIISGDAYQIYKELNIGSAKIKKNEQEGIPHYLIDELTYKEEYNVKLFQEKGRACITDIISRGKTPIVCGGTGLYIKALLYDYAFEEEEVDEAYLSVLKKMDDKQRYNLLQEVDPQACHTIHPNNQVRVIRALMMAHSGSTKSERIAKQEHKLLYDAYVIALDLERDILYENINNRVLQMMEDGLLEEINYIVEEEDTFTLQSMQGIGYKEWLPYYKKEASVEEVVASIQKNSRNFAKRQFTWFRNQMDVHWIHKSQGEQAIVDVKQFLNENKTK